MRLQQLIIATTLFVGLGSAQASFKAFKVEDIKVNGLQRTELGTFFTYLPLQVGETIDEARLPDVIRALYRSGTFDYVSVSRENDVLIFEVEERPIIADIVIDGNSQLKTEDLLSGMQGAGFAKGEVYEAAALEAISSEIESQYFSHGKYGVKVKSRAVNMSRNRVQVRLDINEGDAATIQEINIVGNKIFEDDALLDQFELSTGGFFSFFSSDDQYAAEKLSGDLEKLRNYYLDRGYLKFQIVSTQVAISPDRKGMFITINVSEGEKYKVSSVKFSGELIVKESSLRAMLPLGKGDTYSGAAISFAEERIAELLGYHGYAFAQVASIPEIDEENKEVALTIFINPKQRTYVRRVNFAGNESTDDHVLRREVRLMEGETLSTRLVERSKTRMERLPYVEEVKVETPKVSDAEDQVDVDFEVKERSAGTISGGLGYGNFYGLSLQAAVSHENFLGSGNQIGFSINTSKAVKNYRFNYTDPYFTPDGISLGYNLSYNETDYRELNINRSAQDSIGIGATMGFPLNEVSRFNVGVNYLSNQLTSFPFTNAGRAGTRSQNILDLFDAFGQDVTLNDTLEFELFELRTSWVRNTLNRSIFPDRGNINRVSLEASVPGSDLEYYKVEYDFRQYFPIAKGWSFLTRFNAAFGDGYGDGASENLPYFKNFRGGSSSSLRGFENNSVGPRDILRSPTTIDQSGSPIVLPPENDFIQLHRFSSGGNAMATASLELIFPTPFAEESRSVRTSFFIDAGNVWDTKFDVSRYDSFGSTIRAPNGISSLSMPDYSDPSNYRVSAGFAIQWLSPMGPISISIGRPIEDEAFDEFEQLQFNIGHNF
ncbi:outer membrane protein assembly factor BamA [Pleionea sp. CnH1-48]|uniref:outer membrane protein assembly factor BamA n=1 Tax=Pleionea sp. CnH1-48 TaxID=2954494 RepID=UPI002097D403|nr:outer membrane protein assembly factor BamA [Pleionea sp. CnH1-48]MCO7226496.1 outer membrane protein assembly factor BamA [Pleionea sp. CnH1-48]